MAMFQEDPDPKLPGVEIRGWMTRPEMQWLHDQAARMRSVVEIGCLIGRSTVAIASGCRGPVFAIDSWFGEGGRKALALFQANVSPYLNVHTIDMPSSAAADLVPEVDMVFIDGDHSEAGITADLINWIPKTKVLLCGHDYGHPDYPAVKAKVDQFFTGDHRMAGSIWYVQLGKYLDREPDNKEKMAILYITHDRPSRMRLTLAHLLESSGVNNADITIVANGATQETIEAVRSFVHPAIKNVIINEENEVLSVITNRFWQENLDYKYLGKVDDDTIIPAGFFYNAWRVLEASPDLGVVSAMHWEASFLPPEPSYAHNIRRDLGIIWQRNVGGCCYLMPSARVCESGYIINPGYFKGGWSEYQWILNANGHMCGYLFPFHFAKHLQNSNIYHRIWSLVGGPATHSEMGLAKEITKETGDADWHLTELDIGQFVAVYKADLPPPKMNLGA